MFWDKSPWGIFIKERFPPLSSLSMIFLFVLANGLLASHLMGVQPDYFLYVPAFLLALSFFFRLRLFDEIKDYEVDLKVNPTRPLARGILTIYEVWNLDLFLIGFEIVIAGLVSRYALLSQLIAIGYSLLMYKEFFVGQWLRKHLTMYAITHTFVSVLIGFSIAVVIVSKPFWEFPVAYFFAGVMFWSLFNLFEFSRKTFAPHEERVTVESYSSLFGIKGAVALSTSQVVIAIILGVYLTHWDMLYTLLTSFKISFVIFALGAMIFIFHPTIKSAKVFRAFSGIFIIFFMACIIGYFIWGI